MRIVYIVNHLVPYLMHGTERATDSYARYLSKRGHEVHVIIIKENGIPSWEKRGEGYFVHAIPFTRKLSYTFGEFLYFLRILLLVKNINPDIIHAQMIQNGRYAVLLKGILGIPAVVASRGSDIYTTSELYKRTIGRFVLCHSDAVIALTKHMKHALQEVCLRKVEVIPNGIEELMEHVEEEEEEFILSVGRLSRIKGFPYLIEAIDTVRRDIPEIKLYIIGEGEERKELEKLVEKLRLENNIVFLGKKSNEEVKEWMRRARVFVLSTLSESFGFVNIEAMSVGTPVIASAVGGIPEIIRDGIEGFLVPPRAPQAIAERILELLKNPELRKKLGENARERAKEYLWPRIIDQLEETYIKTLRKR